MNQILQFPTQSVKVINDMNHVINSEDYRLTLKKNLTISDYTEWMCACMDEDFFNAADDEIKSMVDNYYYLF